MEESDRNNKLLAAREILKSSIERSRNIAIAVDETGSRLSAMRHNLACLQAAIKEMARKCAVYEIKHPINRAIGPAAAISNVLDLVYELQASIGTDPCAAGLCTYLTNIKRLQDALKLLDGNCRLVVLWLEEDVVQVLRNNASGADDDPHLVGVAKVVKILAELQLFCQDGGALSRAFDNLESEYRHLATEINLSNSSSPALVIQGLQGITEAMAASNHLDRCTSVYARVRTAEARAALQGLNADYLDIRLSEIDSVQNVERYIYLWDKHMEFAVRSLLHKEHRLCSDIYLKFGSDVWMNCFAKIATQCGFLDILDFGISVCKCKKEAIKLLSLLKIFSTLDKLRLEFNELFDGKFCTEIQNQTRALVKEVVETVCEIFWELLAQVELQRTTSPPPNGNVPRLVRFVTDYCNQLLEDDNRAMLTRVLEINQAWNQVKYEDGLLEGEIHSIMKAVEINLETWAQSYDDTALSYLFMVNSHWYLCNSTTGTKFEELMGNSWLWACEESTEYYARLYMRESWEKVLVYLREEGLILFPGGRAIDRNTVKKRISGFYEAFNETYEKQSKWALYDKSLRCKMCQLIVEAIVPPYKSYLQRFMHGLDDVGNHVKYTGEKLENLVSILFQPKIGKYGSSKCTDLIGIKNNAAAAVNHFSSTPASSMILICLTPMFRQEFGEIIKSHLHSVPSYSGCSSTV